MRRWLWYGLMLLSLGLWFWFDSRAVVLAALICAVLVPLVCGIFCFVRGKKIRLSMESAEFVQKQDYISVTVHAVGNRWASIRGQLVCRNEKTGEVLRQQVSLRDGMVLALRADHCGPISVELQNVRIWDAFGLWFRRLEGCKCRLTVLADVFPIEVSVQETAAPLLDSDRYSPDRPGNDPSETFGVREYIAGDSIKQIHWKLSEKNDRTFIRELGLPVTDRMLLLVDTSGVESAVTEAAVSISAALAQMGLAHTVGWNDPVGGCFMQERVEMDAEHIRLQLSSLPAAQHAMGVADSYLQEYGHCSFSHVVVLSQQAVDRISELFSGNRVTAVIADGTGCGGLQADGIHAVGFSAETIQTDLQYMEV